MNTIESAELSVEQLEELLAGMPKGELVASGNGVHCGIRAVAITGGDNSVEKHERALFIAAAPSIARQLIRVMKERDRMIEVVEAERLDTEQSKIPGTYAYGYNDAISDSVRALKEIDMGQREEGGKNG